MYQKKFSKFKVRRFEIATLIVSVISCFGTWLAVPQLPHLLVYIPSLEAIIPISLLSTNTSASGFLPVTATPSQPITKLYENLPVISISPTLTTIQYPAQSDFDTKPLATSTRLIIVPTSQLKVNISGMDNTIRLESGISTALIKDEMNLSGMDLSHTIYVSDGQQILLKISGTDNTIYIVGNLKERIVVDDSGIGNQIIELD